LDLGCAAELDTTDVVAVNVHHALSLLAFQRTSGLDRLVCSRPEELAFSSNSFDAVVCGDMLQSVADDLLVLREIRRVLKDGGLLCLTAPAYMFLWGEEDEARGHERRYTGSDLRRKLNTCGFEIHRVSYFVAAGLLPAFVQRMGKDIFKKTATRGPQSGTTLTLATGAMVSLLDCERVLMRYINLPFGTRLVAWARKPALVTERVTLPAWERQWVRQPLPQGSNYTALPEIPSAS
jgi:SAM-dependent methyltransferase